MRVVIVFLMFLPWSLAYGKFNIPELSGPVIDQVGVLDAQARSELDQFLRNLNGRKKVQLQVLVVDTLSGDSIEEASIRTVEQYQLGDKKLDNGILFFVVVNDHRMRIEVGQGLECALTDLASKRISSDVIKPFFKANQYGQGIRAGVFAIAEKVDPESLGGVQWTSGEGSDKRQLFVESNGGMSFGKKIEVFLYLLFIFFFFISSRVRSAFGGGRRGGPWMGGGSGWGGGSGGWSGGGGGFSGGGSSDSW